MNYYKVEYDRKYHGGDYSDVGEFALVPEDAVDKHYNAGNIPLDVAVVKAFLDLNPGTVESNIVSFQIDTLYDADGDVANPILPAAIQVSLDGGKTYQPAPQGVRIVYAGLDMPGEDEIGELHLNCTPEGVISDVWVQRGDESHNLATKSEMTDDIVERLVEENS